MALPTRLRINLGDATLGAELDIAVFLSLDALTLRRRNHTPKSRSADEIQAARVPDEGWADFILQMQADGIEVNHVGCCVISDAGREPTGKPFSVVDLNIAVGEQVLCAA